MKKPVDIMIVGDCSSGKSTIAKLIAGALRDERINVVLVDDETHTKKWQSMQPERLEAIANANLVDVSIYVAQRNRNKKG